jgi:3-dehydroquinate synthase
MPINTIPVALDRNAYNIHVGENLLHEPEYLFTSIKGKQVMLVSNDTIAPIYLEKIKTILSAYQCDAVILPDGEQFKTWEQLQTIFTALITHHHERSTTLIALGGGVIGDMTGFAAAVYLRGVNFIQMPTSLLAQVDASVGGKTAVNHPMGTNLLGAFYQPKTVFIELATLNTLPDRELRAGLAEVIKHALIADAEFFTWLEGNMPALLVRDMTALQHAVVRCCEIKAKIVAADEREQGIRAWLNLGHTFAHAIEQATHYEWLHGEAVAAGMVQAALLSRELGYLFPDVVERIIALIQAAGLPTKMPEFSAETYINYMQHDKKNKNGEITFILLRDIGQAVIVEGVPVEALGRVLG